MWLRCVKCSSTRREIAAACCTAGDSNLHAAGRQVISVFFVVWYVYILLIMQTTLSNAAGVSLLCSFIDTNDDNNVASGVSVG
jgi:hypothetical protein